MIFQHIRNVTSMITYGNKRILVDPFLSDKGSLPSVPSKYNNEKNSLVDLPFEKEKIVKDVDAIIVTHMHHFDKAAINVLNKNIPIFTQNKTEAKDMQKLGFKEVRVMTEDGVQFDDIQIFKTYAEHGRGKGAEDNYKQRNIPSEASGFILKNAKEKTIYFSGDTLLNDFVFSYIDKYTPEIIVLNAAKSEFYDGTQILMGMEDLEAIANYKQETPIIAVHLDAVNHATITRKKLKTFVSEHGLSKNVFIPEDGEILSF